MVRASIQYALPLIEGEKLKILSLKGAFCSWLTCTSLASLILIVLPFDIIPVVYDSMYLLNSGSTPDLAR